MPMPTFSRHFFNIDGVGKVKRLEGQRQAVSKNKYEISETIYI